MELGGAPPWARPASAASTAEGGRGPAAPRVGLDLPAGLYRAQKTQNRPDVQTAEGAERAETAVFLLRCTVGVLVGSMTCVTTFLSRGQ